MGGMRRHRWLVGRLTPSPPPQSVPPTPHPWLYLQARQLSHRLATLLKVPTWSGIGAGFMEAGAAGDGCVASWRQVRQGMAVWLHGGRCGRGWLCGFMEAGAAGDGCVAGDARGYRVHASVYMCVCMHMCVWACVCVCMGVCMHMCVWVCLRVCVFVYGCARVVHPPPPNPQVPAHNPPSRQ